MDSGMNFNEAIIRVAPSIITNDRNSMTPIRDSSSLTSKTLETAGECSRASVMCIRHAYEIHLTEMNAPTGECVRRLLKDFAMALACEPDGRNDHEEVERERERVSTYVCARVSGGAWFEPPQAARAMVISWLAPRFCRDRFPAALSFQLP